MPKRALVIGSEIRGLQGVKPDVEAMSAALAARGFELDQRLGASASRAGILEGYRALTEASAAGDVAVVYYSGHGQYTFNKNAAPEQRRWLQGIVPTDFDESTDADYRGISAWEMSFNLERLTRKTHNVTVILDCCHSSRMSRGLHQQATTRALPHPLWLDFSAHLDELRQLYPDADGALTPEWSNPHAVRLVACGQAEAAHEYRGPDGIYHGAFTENLLELMRHAEDGSISWAALGRAVRERVQRIFATQRPEIEGPGRRRLFSLVEEDESGAVPLSTSRRQHHLRAGRLAGVSVGDVYSVMPLGAARIVPEAEIARVAVISSTATRAEVLVKEWRNGKTSFSDDAVALPRERAAPRRPIAVIASPQDRAELEKAISLTRTLRVTARDEQDGADEPLATLRLEGDVLTVEDAHGVLAPGVRYPRELPYAMSRLVDLGVAQGLRELEGEHGISAEHELSIELGLVRGGELLRLADRGARLGPGDLVGLRLTCRSHRRLYFHVFNLGVHGQVHLVNSNSPSGISLVRGEYYTLGESDATRILEGMEVSWPEDLPADRPRLDELVVIVTTKPTDLTMLNSRTPSLDAEEPITRKPGGSPLQDLLAQLQDGLPREVGLRETDPFLLERLSYFLEPQAVLRDEHGVELPAALTPTSASR